MPVRIVEIEGGSGFLEAGDLIMEIDGSPVRDQLDFFYMTADEDSVRLCVEKADGTVDERDIDPSELEKAGPVLEGMRFMQCRSRCPFCFVDQMPPGLRESLYEKDDDYRLSFLYGNYVTLNDIEEEELERIIEMNLSPLYVSVHATDEDARRGLFGRPMKRDIMETLGRLAEGGIRLHAQIVLVPGLNDGQVLENTVRDLFSLYPGCRTVAVVPVGLTAHRDGLATLERVGPEQAGSLLELGGRLAREFEEITGGERFLYMADEIYLLAEMEPPPAEEYGEMEQLSNGVGMSRLFIDGVLGKARRLAGSGECPTGRITVATGVLGGRLIERHVLPALDDILPGLDVDLLVVENRLFGSPVTVSGLLSGGDILRAARSREGRISGCLVMPGNSVNHEGLMIDGTRPEDISAELGVKVVVSEEDFLEDRILEECGAGGEGGR